MVAVLDAGLEHTHPDLRRNYDARASYDFIDLDADPMPRFDPNNNNAHGTSVAGLIAAAGQNSICIIGIAYNARIGGIRMLDGKIMDETMARSLSHAGGYVDIYVASWGPTDDGKTVVGPQPYATDAIRRTTETVQNLISASIV